MKLQLDGVNADSMVQMLRAAFTLENWESILLIADRLYTEVDNIYKVNQREIGPSLNLTTYNLKRNIVYYFGYSMTLKGLAFQYLGRYEEAKACIEKYSGLEWVHGLDAEGWAEVEYYRDISFANRCVIDLLEGKIDVLPDYLKFLKSNEEELLPGMLTILESAITHKYSIDSILTDFEKQIATMGDYYETERNIRYYVDYTYLISKYYSTNGKYYDSINNILKTLTSSIKLKDDTGFRKSVALFESIREHSNSDQLAEYQTIMLKILN